MCAKSLQSVRLLATLWTVAHQAPLSMRFSSQEYWCELLCFPPGDLLDPAMEPYSLKSPSLAGRFFTTSATWRAPCLNCMYTKTHEMYNIKSEWRTSLVVRWLRIHQSMQRMQVWPLVWEGSAKHSVPQIMSLHTESPGLETRSHHNEKPVYCSEE